MEEKLYNYVQSLFADAPQTKRTYELQEEMAQNLREKYNDLLSQGKTETVAYNIAVASIGDVSDLLRQLDAPVMPEDKKRQNRHAVCVAVAVMLYILSVVPIVIVSEVAPGFETLGVVLLFVFVAVATGLLIFDGMTRPRYRRADDTLVEEFREFSAKKSHSPYRPLHGALWLGITAIYFIISFITSQWHITWIIFLIGACVDQVLRAILSLRR